MINLINYILFKIIIIIISTNMTRVYEQSTKYYSAPNNQMKEWVTLLIFDSSKTLILVAKKVKQLSRKDVLPKEKRCTNLVKSLFWCAKSWYGCLIWFMPFLIRQSEITWCDHEWSEGLWRYFKTCNLVYWVKWVIKLCKITFALQFCFSWIS